MTRFRRWPLVPVLVVSAVALTCLAAVTLLDDSQYDDRYFSRGGTDTVENPAHTAGAPAPGDGAPAPAGAPGAPGPADTAGATAPPCSDAGTRSLVEPAGTAFTFRMPSCFRSPDDGEVELSDGAETNVVARSVIVPTDVEIVPGRAVRGSVIVSAGTLEPGLVGANEAAIEARLLHDLGRARVAHSEPRRRTVDGAPGWGFSIRKSDEESMIWVFVKGRSQVQVVCRWIEPALQARVTSGCDGVVDSLTIA